MWRSGVFFSKVAHKNHASPYMFADDIALYHITSPSDYAVLQEDISAISTFLDYKHLNFNEDKINVTQC